MITLCGYVCVCFKGFRLRSLKSRALIQYSVFQTDRRRVAVAAKRLAEHYGASTEVFRGQKTEQ
jgi:hypothetical protein